VQYPSHLILGDDCPGCRRILSDEYSQQHINTIWDEAEAQMCSDTPPDDPFEYWT
jgi:hypothetical protein